MIAAVCFYFFFHWQGNNQQRQCHQHKILLFHKLSSLVIYHKFMANQNNNKIISVYLRIAVIFKNVIIKKTN